MEEWRPSEILDRFFNERSLCGWLDGVQAMDEPHSEIGADFGAPEIGPVLRQRRKNRGLTLEQLAKLSGVSKSMLSQVERGLANPTFATLWSLTRALKIEFADLLEGGSAQAAESTIEVLTAANTPEMKSPDGLCSLRILSPPGMSGQMEWYEVGLAPGGVLDSKPHSMGAFEHFTALDDGLELTSGRSTCTLKAGETARYPADVQHRISNTSSTDARGLMIVLFR
jgi:transcriptional regulator with XRE-family HTH domain